MSEGIEVPAAARRGRERVGNFRSRGNGKGERYTQQHQRRELRDERRLHDVAFANRPPARHVAREQDGGEEQGRQLERPIWPPPAEKAEEHGHGRRRRGKPRDG